MVTKVKALSIGDLRRKQDLSKFKFESTAELEKIDFVIGQDRAVSAVMFGIEIESEGYHIYAMGDSGTGKTSIVERFLTRQTRDEPVPDDWAYFNNFAEEDKPRALRLPAGQGCKLREDLNLLVEEMETELSQAFETEEYGKDRDNIQRKFQEKRQEIFGGVEETVNEKGFTLLQTPSGVAIVPTKDGEAIGPGEITKLSSEEQERIQQDKEILQETLQSTIKEVQQLQKHFKEELRELDRQTVGYAVNHMIDDLIKKYKEFDQVVEFLKAIREDILDNVHEFKQKIEEDDSGPPNLLKAMQSNQKPFDKYRINLIVDNCESEGSPVIFEENPTYHNLIGRVEHEARFGALETNFMMIKAGALHKANGGYLVLKAKELLTKPFSWEALERALETKSVQIEPIMQGYQAIATRGLEPEPIPLNLKVLLVGDAMIYYLLYQHDESFRELFKVKADFGNEMDLTDDAVDQYARFIGTISEERGLLHFSPSGVARIVEESSRMVSDQEKLATRFSDIVDLLQQSSYWAKKDGKDLVTAEDVQQALDAKIYRSNRVEKLVQEEIERKTIRIETEGEAVGQVNGISILPFGDYMFGKPSRITARTHVGKAGVVNIERETELGGKLHNKGVMILTGYLGGKYAQDFPLTLSASLTFEQLYSGVEGDSASSAELYALLSSISGLPLRQDIAVTGSVDQHGNVQAIGGVNRKIEGFFEVCKQKGLTGTQGVMIPETNVKHLMLNHEVLNAVEDGDFHIYPISTINEGISLLTGRDVGEKQVDGEYPPNTVNWEIKNGLEQLAERVKSFASEDGQHE
jgi:lon-related putative ATP-dependent protease